MTDVQVTFTGSASPFVVQIDGKKLSFNSAGTAATKLKGDMEYTIQWFVRGVPGSNYTISLTKPAEAKFIHSATLDGSKKDAGIFWFKLKPEAGS